MPATTHDGRMKTDGLFLKPSLAANDGMLKSFVAHWHEMIVPFDLEAEQVLRIVCSVEVNKRRQCPYTRPRSRVQAHLGWYKSYHRCNNCGLSKILSHREEMRNSGC